MSTTVTLLCPHCSTKLKIKDASLFGQKVKCPGCKERFVLKAPESQDETPPFPATSPTAATPDQTRSRATVAPKADFPTFPPVGDNASPAQSEPERNQSQPALPPGGFPGFPPIDPPVNTSEDNPFAAFNQVPASAPKAASASPGFPLETDPDEPIIVRKRKSRNWGKLLAQGALGVAAIGIIAFFAMQERKPIRPNQGTQPTAHVEEEAPSLDPNQPYSREMLEKDPTLVAEFNPTRGQPIQLLMMPSGVNMVLHLRPSSLWSDTYDNKVLRASLTDDLVSWMSQQIKDFTKFAPEEIEELTLGVLFGARGVPPQYACVVKLKEPQKLSTLLDLFPGKYLHDISQRPDLRIKVDEVHGYLIKDDRTFAICPAGAAGDLEYSINTPNQDASAGLLELLALSDDQRLLTVVADVRDLQIHQNHLVPVASQAFMNAVTSWMGDNTEMISWSLHPEGYFHSTLIARPVTTKSPATFEGELRTKLAQLSERVWKEVAMRMHPTEMRFRSMIGRLPAMLEAFAQSTVIHRQQRNVILTTVLPAKAAPNLALATLFAVDEASRTNFTLASSPKATATRPKLPDSVADRLKVNIDIEFSRTPLEQALTYLTGEIEVKLYVDGDALKDAGYTKNMPQTFNLGKASVQKGLFAILKQYQEPGKEMVISIDENKKLLTVLTRKFAEANGLPVYELKDE